MDPVEQKNFEKFKARNSKRFTQKELDKYREILLAIRSKIAKDIEHLEKENLNSSQKEASGDLSGYSLHMADIAFEFIYKNG